MSAVGIRHWTGALDDALKGYPVAPIAIEYALEALPKLGVNTDRWASLKPAPKPSAIPTIPPNMRRAAEYFADATAA